MFYVYVLWLRNVVLKLASVNKSLRRKTSSLIATYVNQ